MFTDSWHIMGHHGMKVKGDVGLHSTDRELVDRFRAAIATKSPQVVQAESGGEVSSSSAHRYKQKGYYPSRMEADLRDAITRYLERVEAAVKFRDVSHGTMTVREAAGEYLADNGRSPLLDELARIDGLDLDEWDKAARAERAMAAHRQQILEAEVHGATVRAEAERDRARAMRVAELVALTRAREISRAGGGATAAARVREQRRGRRPPEEAGGPPSEPAAE